MNDFQAVGDGLLSQVADIALQNYAGALGRLEGSVSGTLRVGTPASLAALAAMIPRIGREPVFIALHLLRAEASFALLRDFLSIEDIICDPGRCGACQDGIAREGGLDGHSNECFVTAIRRVLGHGVQCQQEGVWVGEHAEGGAGWTCDKCGEFLAEYPA